MFSNLLNQWAHLHHQIITIIYCMHWFFGSFIPKYRDLDSRLGGCRTCIISDLFFKFAGRYGQKTQEDNYSGHEHLTASMQSRKYSEDIFKMKFGRTRRCLQKYSDACNTRLRRARGLVRSGYTGLYTWHTFRRIRVGIWPTPYICVTTRSLIELLLQ
jgi:hypothetical protein